MSKVVSFSSRMKYCLSGHTDPNQTVDIHDIFIVKSKLRWLAFCLSVLPMISLCILLLSKEKSDTSILWVILLFLSIISVIRLNSKNIKKESVMIMRSFGIQLETHYWSGKVRRRFISIDNILKPVMNECVTPMTCYWTLSLILCDEDELVLVFKESHIPIKTMIPVWKALRAALDCRERHVVISETK
ncbi:Phosphatidylinositol N-acetylglucosaminyltransferase [Zostera marina]|uniref:Phosphatidylinositol N-acetylglucosaminyltransferase n=1 Tax=Zostera marina TaxID=29655 RepID=A0A0K9PUE1_ZOSMR|nr:Phosphatidylinositol N-acetylglucosaminyltransferase [Zostera marina]